MNEEQLLKLLEDLLPVQFKKVLFLYKIPPEILPSGVPQTEKAIALLEYALQNEGEPLTQLRQVIKKVAPSVQNNIYNQKDKPLLPYLLNRDEQIFKLREAIEAHKNMQSPLLCFIHGDEYQCSDKLIDRFAFQVLGGIQPKYFTFPNGFENSGKVDKPAIFNGIDLYNLLKKWHPNKSDEEQQEFSKKILANLDFRLKMGKLDKLDHQEPSIPSLAEIAKQIADKQEKSSVLLYTTIITDDWQHCGQRDIIHQFIDFWANWPSLPNQNHLLVVCLCFNYLNTEKMTWFKRFGSRSINQTIRARLKELNSPKNSKVLPELLSIKRTHVEDLVRSDMNKCLDDLMPHILPELLSIKRTHVEQLVRLYMNKCLDDLMPHIRELFSTSEKIAMEPLAFQLKKLFQEYCDQRD